jgi:cleavage and polyadenylation specificity factor subunit 3
MNAIRVIRISDTEIQMQWVSNTSNDMIADSALVVLLGIDCSPATVKRKLHGHSSF